MAPCVRSAVRGRRNECRRERATGGARHRTLITLLLIICEPRAARQNERTLAGFAFERPFISACAAAVRSRSPGRYGPQYRTTYPTMALGLAGIAERPQWSLSPHTFIMQPCPPVRRRHYRCICAIGPQVTVCTAIQLRCCGRPLHLLAVSGLRKCLRLWNVRRSSL
jgi:hypothetical protein